MGGSTGTLVVADAVLLAVSVGVDEGVDEAAGAGDGCVINLSKRLRNVCPCVVSVLVELMRGTGVLIPEYCMEAKTSFAASVCNAFCVQVAMKFLSVLLPSFGVALAA